MPSPSRPRRSLLALAIVVTVLGASAPGAALGGERDGGPRRTAAVGPFAAPGAPGAARPADVAAGSGHPGAVARDSRLVGRRSDAAPAARSIRADWIRRAVTDVPEPRAKSVSPAPAGGSAAHSGPYRGRNHVWIPALGIDRSVTGFACSSSAYPGNRVYRWGCAGSNNVYLFGHAYSVFKPLHDAYVRGRLAKGMRVMYADGGGYVTTYAVSWWRVTTPDNGAWAYAAQSSPSLTLQTCVGAQSQYRLIVRLRKVG